MIHWQADVPSSFDLFQGQAHALADLASRSHRQFLPIQPNSIRLPTMKARVKEEIGQYQSAAVVVPTNSKNVARLLSNYPAIMLAYFPRSNPLKSLQQHG